MPPFRKPLASFCRRLGCASLSCFNLVLAFIALSQSTFLLFNGLQKVIPVPDKIIRHSFQKVLGSQYRVSWESLAFDLTGGLFLRGFSLREANREEAFLTSRALHLDLALLNLLFGSNPPLESLRALDLTCSLPPEETLSGLHESILTIPEAALHLEEASLILDYLLIDSRRLRLITTGTAPLNQLTSFQTSEESPQLSFSNILNALNQLPSEINLYGRVHVEMDLSGRLTAEAQLSSPQALLSGLTARRILASASLQFQGTLPSLTSFSLEGQLTELSPSSLPAFPNLELNLPTPFSLSASGPLIASSSFQYPSQLHLTLFQPLLSPLPLRSFALHLSLARKPLHLTWNAKGTGTFAAGSLTRVHDSEDPFPFSLRFRASLLQPLLRDLFPSLPHHPLLEEAHAAFLRLDASFLPAPKSLSGLLTTDYLHLGRTDFDHLHTRFHIDPSAILLDPVFVRKSHNESASGSYSHHFSSSRFSLNASGAIFPASLDAILGSWWVRIFNPVQTAAPLQGDVSVWGQWNDPTSLQSVTAVSGSGASYRGITIPSLRLKVRSNRQWAYLDELEARFPKGSVSGRIGWRQGLGKGTPRPMILDFRSDGPWAAVRAASGVEALSRLKFSGHPRVRAKGVLWRTPRESTPAEAFVYPNLSFELSEREAECRLESLRLSDLRFAGNLKGNTLNLDSLTGDFAEGVFTGRMRIRDWDKPAQREQRLSLQLFDAEYLSALTQLSGLLDEPGLLEGALLHGDTRGRLDTSVELITRADLDKAVGTGQVTLRDANISKIHLLGGLSRILDDIGLGFSTVNLNAASVAWSLSNSRLRIEEGLLTGPVVSLRAAGGINLKSRLLNLDADLLLLQGVLSKVLSPVSNTIELKITGPIQEPVWNMNLTPLRWFQNRLSSKPPQTREF